MFDNAQLRPQEVEDSRTSTENDVSLQFDDMRVLAGHLIEYIYS